MWILQRHQIFCPAKDKGSYEPKPAHKSLADNAQLPLSLTNIENRFNTKYCVQPHSKPHQIVVFACFSVIPRRF